MLEFLTALAICTGMVGLGFIWFAYLNHTPSK